jgi:hypothetical protein
MCYTLAVSRLHRFDDRPWRWLYQRAASIISRIVCCGNRSRSRTVSQRDYPTPTHQLNLPGQVVFAPGDGSLWLQNANGSSTHVLVKSTGESYAESPAFSPDGKRVAYAVQAYTQNGEMLEDVRVVNLDGKKKEESPGRKN